MSRSSQNPAADQRVDGEDEDLMDVDDDDDSVDSNEIDEKDIHEHQVIVHQLYYEYLTPNRAAAALASRVTASADVYRGLWRLWQSIIRIVPENPRVHLKLAAAMERLAGLPNVLDGNGHVVKFEDEVLWRDMPRWSDEWNDEWNSLCIPDEAGPDRTTAIATRRQQNRFSALLLTTRVPSLRSPLHALWTFRNALEEVNSSSDLDMFVPDAALWIEIAGAQILACDERFPSEGRGGRRWQGRHGFVRGRWNLWKVRFGEIAVGGEVTRLTADVALKAAQKMASIDGTNTFREEAPQGSSSR